MYTTTDIFNETGILRSTLKSRAEKNKLGTIKGHSRLFTKEEKEKLIDDSLYKVGKRKMEVKREIIDLSKIRLTRERTLLFILQSIPVTSIIKTKLHKLLFLLNKELNINIGYDFFPYKYGAYSLELQESVDRLKYEGILTETNGYKLTSSLNVSSLKNKDKILTDLNIFRMKYPEFFTQNVGVLLKDLYQKYPSYAKNSDKKNLIDQSLLPVEKVDPLFSTIGYEGKSLDYYINQLVVNDIKCLVDVRKNAWSQKKGFTGYQLKDALKKVKIEYIHMPSLGIEPSERQELNNDNAYKDLFINYSSSLPRKTGSLEDLYDVFTTRNRIAITCFEAEKHKCHRFYLAEYLAKQKGFKINHIEG